jgi:VWFA-related protein
MKALLLVAAVALAAFGQRQTFRVGVEAVRVDVLAIDGSRPIGGLTAGDFELRDSGVVQQIVSAAFEDAPLSVMLALDTSRSVQGTPLAHLKDAAAAAVALLAPRDRGALLTFSSELDLRADWSADHHLLAAAIADATAAGATSLHDAAYAALTLRDTDPGRTLVLLFSDGQDTMSWLPGQTVIGIAQRTDAVVYGIGLRTVETPDVPGFRVDFRSGLQPDIPNVPAAVLMQSFLTALAAETGGKYLEAEGAQQLRETFVQVITEFRSRYVLTYVPRGVESTGWHPIEVKLKGRRGKVIARRGYLR